MLKIHYSLQVLKTYAGDHADKLLPLLKKRLKNADNVFLKDYFSTDALIKGLVSATPGKLLLLNQDIYRTLNVKYKVKNIKDAAGRVFNYEQFKIRKPGNYRGDDLCKLLDFKTCPYCNVREIAVTLDAAGTVTSKPALDHFFSEGRYPFLALSFFNLVPCCTVCNTNFKGGTGMILRKNTHPYMTGFGDECVFDVTNIKDIDNILGLKKSSFEIYFDNTGKQKKKFQGNIDLFKLDDQYRHHTEEARLALRRAFKYGQAELNSILKISNADPDTAFETAFGTKFKFNELHQRPMSKLTRDLVKQYGNPDVKSILKVT